jgi:N-acetyltransferase
MFDFKTDYRLENDRVLLRPLNENDLGHLLPFAIMEPELWQYSLISAAGEAGMKNYFHQALAAREAQKEYPFIVFDKEKQRYAGSTRFYDVQLLQLTLQLGYTWYGKDFQGTGLNRNCKFLLLGFAFERMQMERVEFRADNRNARSIAAMKNIGCTEEGVLRSHLIKADGIRRDSIVLSILKSEWVEKIKDELSVHAGNPI